jgi:hypothetical protein
MGADETLYSMLYSVLSVNAPTAQSHPSLGHRPRMTVEDGGTLKARFTALQS